MPEAWWKERVFYQIYPRSFQDSNGDGIGDLRGIISRLDYLKSLGVGAVWLCPVYDSPNDGHGLRHPRLREDNGRVRHDGGLRRAAARDAQPGHKARHGPRGEPLLGRAPHGSWSPAPRSENPYRDYYIWRDGKDGREPNNWASFFTPSAWSYDEGTGQWYLHLFSEKQPDLNWENPSVREEVYSMINRWFDRGVDGFRMDVITVIAKAPGLPDGKGAPGAGGYVFSPEHFAFQPKLHEYLREMRRRCFDGRDCMCVGETSFVNTENANSLVGDGRELDLLFQFDLMDMDGEGSKWNAIPLDVPKLKRIVAAWQGAIDWNTLFLGNHDQPRVVSRFGDTSSEELWKRSARCLATLMYLQRGTPFIYQGEELGMTNAPFETREQLRDVEELNLLALCSSEAELEWAWRGIKAKGRDNARTPMQWSAGENADFTTGEPWIMLNPNYTDINAEAEEGDPDSVLNYYRALIALRDSTPALLRGDWRELLPESGQVVAYTRGLDGEEYAVLCNLSRESAPLPCRLGDFGEPVLSNMPADPAAEALRPYEAQVLKKG